MQIKNINFVTTKLKKYKSNAGNIIAESQSIRGAQIIIAVLRANESIIPV